VVKAPQSSTHKKVVVRKLDRESVKGYVNPSSYLAERGVELMDLDGRRTVIPLEVVKGIYFVREFDGNSDRTERKIFLSRPKMSGLWVRMTFKDAEVLDGMIPEDLLDIGPDGFLITPPDVYSNNLRIFVPRSALESLVVLGVTSNGGRQANGSSRRYRRVTATASRQMQLFTAP
jgi:Family of unknown function (DUF6982)